MAKSASPVEIVQGHIDSIFTAHLNAARQEVKTMLPAIMAQAFGVQGQPVVAPQTQPDLRNLAKQAASANPPKKRGRPPKAKTEQAAAPADAPKKKRGRPPKNAAAVVAAAQTEAAAEATPTEAAPKKRGRPKGSKNKSAAKPEKQAAASTEPAKKRGRPKGSKNKAAASEAPANGSENTGSLSYEELKAKVMASRGANATAN